MTLLEIIKNKLEGKTILINNRWRYEIAEVLIDYEDCNCPQLLQLKCKSPSKAYQYTRISLDEEFEIITKE